MADLAPFGEEGFDPAEWVNAAVNARPQDQAVEKYLAEVEMRLQLAAEELEVSLAETSATALRRVPFAQQEVSRLQSDAAALAAGVRSLLASADADAAAANAAAGPLAAMHGVKTRMEAACATLREATELSGAFRQVEDLFSTGDLPRVAELLRAMGRSLALVGDVPEFREGKARLSALEDRLQRRVEGRLGDALAADDAKEVSALAAILLAVGRGPTLEKLYVASRLPRITEAWDAATRPAANQTAGGAAAAGGGAAAAGVAAAGLLGGGALLSGYNAVLSVLEAEAAWLGGCLPEQRAALLSALTLAGLGKINRPLRERLSALSAPAPLQGLLGDALAFSRGVTGALRGAGAEGPAVSDALKASLEPLEEQITRLPQLEEAALASELSRAIGCDPTASDLDAAAAALSNGADGAFAALRAAADRCVALTGGTELPALVKVLDSAAQQYLTRLQAAAGVLHGRFAAAAAATTAAAAAAGGGVAPPPDLSAVLSLVLVARRAGAALAGLEAASRGAAVAASAAATAAAAAGPAGAHATAAAAELLPLRLAAFPGKLAPLERLRDRAAADPRFLALRASTAAADALFAHVSDLVYASLLAPIEAALQPLPGLPTWAAAALPGAGGAAAAGPVPQFSAYPSPSVTGVGEYLMGVPAQLEVLMADEEAAGGGGAAGGGAEGGDELAAEWLDKVVRGAGLTYADAVLRIPALGAGGAAQLAADAEYFANVMSALAVAPPAVLITVQVFANLPADQFSEAASAAVAEGSADPRVLRRLAAMRGNIGWEGGSAAAMAAAAGPGQRRASAAGGGGGEEAAAAAAAEGGA